MAVSVLQPTIHQSARAASGMREHIAKPISTNANRVRVKMVAVALISLGITNVAVKVQASKGSIVKRTLMNALWNVFLVVIEVYVLIHADHSGKLISNLKRT